MTSQAFTIGFCILWVLLCARLWWMVGSKHAWQRHLIAIGAGLGAALIYIFGHLVGTVLANDKAVASPPTSGEQIKVSPGVPKN